MAVHKRTYRCYSGQLTGARTRFLVLFRYSWGNILHAIFVTECLFACLLVVVVFAALICLSHSVPSLALLGVDQARAGDFVNGAFFYRFIQIELGMALILVAIVGPGLISSDLANQALPLYFSRPLSRGQYVLGRFSVLAALISAISWLPGLVLFALQSDLAGWRWAVSHLWIARSIFLSSMVLLLVFSALALAFSSWLQSRVMAGGAMLGVFFVGAGLGHMFDATLRTHWGGLVDLGGLMEQVISSFFRIQGNGGRASGIPTAAAIIALLALCAFCVCLIERRIRAREVVRV